MATIKKRVLLAGSLVLSSLGLVIIGAEQQREIEQKVASADVEPMAEVAGSERTQEAGEAEQAGDAERKEAVARDPQGRVVPFAGSTEMERKGIAARRLGRIATMGEATRRLAPGGVSPFAQAVATRARTPLAGRIGELPIDAQINIASYLEEDKYDLWKTLNTPADQLAFRGNDLVSVFKDNEENLQVSVRNMVTGDITKRFTVPGPLPRKKNFLLSADGKRVAVLIDSMDRIDVWDTVTGTIIKSIDYAAPNIPHYYRRLIGFSPDGTILAARVPERNDAGFIGKQLILFNLVTDETIRLPGSTGFRDRKAFALTHDTFAAASKGKPITFWNTANGMQRNLTGLSLSRPLDTNNGGILEFGFSPDGTIFAVSYYETSALGSTRGTITLF